MPKAIREPRTDPRQCGMQVLSHTLAADSPPARRDPLPERPETRIHFPRNILARANVTASYPGSFTTRASGPRHFLIGKPSQVADQLRSGTRPACDGITPVVPYLPGGLESVVDILIPELQRRGLFRTEYEGTTLRESLGLTRPANRFFASDLVAAE